MRRGGWAAACGAVLEFESAVVHLEEVTNMCNRCSSGQSAYGHGVRVGQQREANDRNPARAARDPYYGGRAAYDAGRNQAYRDGVRQGRENVRRSKG